MTWGVCSVNFAASCCESDATRESNEQSPTTYRVTLNVDGADQLPAGEYLLWVSCSHMRNDTSAFNQGRRNAPLVGPNRSVMDLRGAAVGAYKEAWQIEGSPFRFALSDPWKLLPRRNSHRHDHRSSSSSAGERFGRGSRDKGHCLRADTPGWWVASGAPGSERGAAPGVDAAMWQDSHVWAPHGCAFQSYTRAAAKQCLARLDGMLLLFGDSEMRGLFCDLDNWLRRQLTKGSLPPYHLNNVDSARMGRSTWDELVCGFNGNLGHSNQLSACALGPRVQSYVPESLLAEVVTPGACSKHRREFAFRLHGDHPEVGYVETIGLARTVIRVKELAKAGFRTVNGTVVRAIALHSCLWDMRAKNGVGSIHSMWDEIGRLLREFEGTVFLLGCPPVHNMGDLRGGLNGEVARAIQRAHYRLEANLSKPGLKFHVVDLVATGMARPDRSLDSFHMYARKCTGSPGWQQRVCVSGARDVNGCCLPADSMPFTVSFTWVQMMLNLLCLQRGGSGL